jgi:hypothetical protein
MLHYFLWTYVFRSVSISTRLDWTYNSSVILGLFQKFKKREKAGGMVQVVECLPSKLKALSSNPKTTQKWERGKTDIEIIYQVLLTKSRWKPMSSGSYLWTLCPCVHSLSFSMSSPSCHVPTSQSHCQCPPSKL